MATSRDVDAMKKAGILIKEQEQLASEDVNVAKPKGPQKKAGKRPMVEARSVDPDSLQPKGKKGKPAAGSVGNGKRKAKGAPEETTPAEGKQEDKAGAKQPKAKAADIPAVIEQPTATEHAPVKKQKASKKAAKTDRPVNEDDGGHVEGEAAPEEAAPAKKGNAGQKRARDASKPEEDAKEGGADAEKPAAKKAGKAAKKPTAVKEAKLEEVKTSRGRTTKGVNYKEGSSLGPAGETVAAKKETLAASEAAAIAAISKEAKSFRLLDVAVFDEAGEPQALDRVQQFEGSLFGSGVLFPAAGALTKLEGQRVAKLGPVQGWRIETKDGSIQIMLKTALAEYICVRAAASYRQLFAHLTEQAEITAEVQKAINPQNGGNPEASLDEVVARLSRAKVGKNYYSARDALVLNGNFVLGQLSQTDAGSAASLTETPFAVSLKQEIADLEMGGNTTGAIVINEPTAAGDVAAARDPLTAAQRAEADLLRQLSAKQEVQKARAAHRRAGGVPKGPAYIKISPAEIAEDYPEPAQYDKEEDETDELLMADDEDFDVDPESLPRRLLKDFSVYDAEGMLSTLELLPMWGGAQPDVELFASGVVVEDDGEWSGGQAVDAAAGEGGSSAAAEPAAAGDGSGGGMRIYSSHIQEWVVEFSCDLLLISIRTDVAWYRLDRPAAKYAPWFNVVLKSARVAVKTLTLLSEETRASKLSFNDVVKKLTAAEKSEATFISERAQAVERFVVVHGQILLNQFNHFPVKAVKNSAFALALKSRMELRRHAKLYFKAAKVARQRANSNPMRDRASVRAKPMTATATKMVREIWQAYFNTGQPANEEGETAAAAVEVDEDLNAEEDDAEEEDALAEAGDGEEADIAAADVEISFDSQPIKKENGNSYYRTAKIGGVEVEAGDVVTLRGGLDSKPPLGLVQALWQAKGGKTHVQLRGVVRGYDTVLGDAAAADELFVTSKLSTQPAGGVAGKLQATRLRRSWKLEERRSHMEADAARRERNAVAAAEGKELEHVFRTLYVPEEGKFCELPVDLAAGERLPEPEDVAQGVSWTADGKGLNKAGVEYHPGDFVFIRPGIFDQLDSATGDAKPVAEYAAKGRFHKGGANAGLRAYGIAQLVSVAAKEAASKKTKSASTAPTKLKAKRFYRPEDISPDLAYSSDFWDVFAGAETVELDVDAIVGRCKVAVGDGRPDDETFMCRKTFDRADGSFSDPPKDLAIVTAKAAAAGKGKSTAGKNVSGPKAVRAATSIDDGISLASMDIFAGCGGLTEGLHQAGAAHAKWAIEYEEPAAEAFRLNHPGAVCWAKNCNVILSAAMTKAGLADLCTASPEAVEQAGQLDEATRQGLPAPGEVEFLCGGPPCQGYSGMNRFNKGNWSMVQNSMVMSYLSFADFYRPRYFLLENVRNFVSHNKSFTFRLTLRSLLDMGYQVRFGVLNAGNFGVSQSRKRTFIWAAAPGELLPDWPKLLHIFHSPQLTINLPGNVKYCAVPQTEGAPLRTVTVKDVISDLPPITNGHAATEMEYTGPAVSAFQKMVRGEESVLRDHICKEMNPLNLERCRCIPKNVPGADWRVLQEIVAKDPSRENFQGQPLVPWCLPNTADRHNGWRGLFGRLDWAGHFPTSTTDPQPMGKVGQVFHPEQDRIVSVRECARAQGFPDSFRFYGNVHNKHRQIGNAVPPPLAFSLGRCLRTALETTAARRQEELLEAQMAALNG